MLIKTYINLSLYFFVQRLITLYNQYTGGSQYYLWNEQIHVNNIGAHIKWKLVTEPQEGLSSMWLKLLGIVGSDITMPIFHVEDRFVSELSVKISRMNQRGIHWNLPGLKGRLESLAQRRRDIMVHSTAGLESRGLQSGGQC